MRSMFKQISTCLFFLAAIAVTNQAYSCPFCDAPSLTLVEQLSASQAAVLVQWAGGEVANREKSFSGTTNYEILEIVTDESGKVKPSNSTGIVLLRKVTCLYFLEL